MYVYRICSYILVQPFLASCINYLCTYKFYGPVHNFFRRIFFHYEGDWAFELETFLGPVKMHELLGECDLEPKKVESYRAQSPE